MFLTNTHSNTGCGMAPDLFGTIPQSPVRVVTPRLEPTIIAAPGSAIDDIVKAPALDRAGIYVGVWYGHAAPVAYSGQSSWCTAKRIGDAKFRCPSAADLLIGVTDSADRLSGADVRVLERLMFLQIIEARYAAFGSVPPGAVVPRERYTLLRRLFGEVCISLKVAGLLFCSVPDGVLLGGPLTERGVLRSDVPIGDRFRLETPRGPAEMVQRGPSYVIVPGSPARCTWSPSLKAIGVLQQELVHGGVVAPTDDDNWFNLTQPIRLSSASAAARFVTGSVAGSPNQWRGISPGGPATPTRAAVAGRAAIDNETPDLTTACSSFEEAGSSGGETPHA